MKNDPTLSWLASLAEVAKKIAAAPDGLLADTLSELSILKQQFPENYVRVLFTKLPGRFDHEYDLSVEDGDGTFVLGFRPNSNLPWTSVHSRHDAYSKEESKDVVLFRIDEIEYDGRTVLRMLEYSTRTEGISIEYFETHLTLLTCLLDCPETLETLLSKDHITRIVQSFAGELPEQEKTDCFEQLRQAVGFLGNQSLVRLSQALLDEIEASISEKQISRFFEQYQEEFSSFEVMQWSAVEASSLEELREVIETKAIFSPSLTWFLTSPKSRKAESQLYSGAELSKLTGQPASTLKIGAVLGPYQMGRFHQLYKVQQRFEPDVQVAQSRIRKRLTQQKMSELKAHLKIEWYLDREALLSAQESSSVSTNAPTGERTA
ncbi:MAG TPA: hypothetical protein PLS70_21870 [Acidobacteriota bacterium]|nr:hypothetical protein [Acidobacteriota bacterium]